MPICRRLERQAVPFAAARTRPTTGSRSEMSTAIRPMTTSSSVMVNPAGRFVRRRPLRLIADSFVCFLTDFCRLVTISRGGIRGRACARPDRYAAVLLRVNVLDPTALIVRVIDVRDVVAAAAADLVDAAADGV